MSGFLFKCSLPKSLSPCTQCATCDTPKYSDCRVCLCVCVCLVTIMYLTQHTASSYLFRDVIRRQSYCPEWVHVWVSGGRCSPDWAV